MFQQGCIEWLMQTGFLRQHITFAQLVHRKSHFYFCADLTSWSKSFVACSCCFQSKFDTQTQAQVQNTIYHTATLADKMNINWIKTRLWKGRLVLKSLHQQERAGYVNVSKQWNNPEQTGRVSRRGATPRQLGTNGSYSMLNLRSANSLPGV